MARRSAAFDFARAFGGPENPSSFGPRDMLAFVPVSIIPMFLDPLVVLMFPA